MCPRPATSARPQGSDGGDAGCLALTNPVHIMLVRRTISDLARRIGMNEVDSVKLGTAVSELARNLLEHGGGGEVTYAVVKQGQAHGVKVVFEDSGPGIADVERAMQDGQSTGAGMGIGLGGAGRLVDSLAVDSTPGRGTRVEIVKWAASKWLLRR